LFLGKDLPDGLAFAEVLADSGRSVFGIAKSEADAAKFDSEKIYATTWNKSSAVSAHSVIIRAETKLEDFDEVLFYFDAANFCTQFEIDRTEDISNAVDTMLNGYLFATSELLKRLDQRKEKISVVFLLKEYPSKYELISSKAAGIVPASTIVSAAQAAFGALAESFSTNVADREYLSVILAKCAYSNELYKNEDAIADWTISALNTIKTLKNPQSVKHATTWNKVGAKVSTGFSLFK
jgi:NAD(P)-dependent dehydrogenase (short-subunit alcohol dehydrogenase family)